MTRMSQKHGGDTLTSESIANLRGGGVCGTSDLGEAIAAITVGWTLRRVTSWLVISFKVGDNQLTRRKLRMERQAIDCRWPHRRFRRRAFRMTAQLLTVRFEKSQRGKAMQNC